jgi:hypothetical protein
MNSYQTAVTNIQRLKIDEKPWIEPENINVLKHALGVEPSRNIVERAACEVSGRLSRLERVLMTGDLAQTAKIAASMIALAEQIGLSTFARVAQNLVDAIHDGDFVAIAAISQRLMRQGEAALFEVVDFAAAPHCS